MLASVVHSGGRDAAANVLRRANRVAGAPSALGGEGGAVVGAWQSSLQPKTERGCAVEGWIEGPWPPKPDVDSLHFSSILRARGDFSFMAATEQGLFLCSGPAGGHRPIFIVAGRDWAAASTQLRVVLALLGERPRLDFDYMADTLSDRGDGHSVSRD